jgi:hypothetical protein
MEAAAKLDDKTRLRMLVTLRKIVKVSRLSGYVSAEDVHTLNTIGFSVITWLYLESGGTGPVDESRRMAEDGHVTYRQLITIIKTYTFNYTVAPWGGPIGESEIYGTLKPRERVPIFWQLGTISALGVFVASAMGWVLPVYSALLWCALAILTLTTLLVQGVKNHEN